MECERCAASKEQLNETALRFLPLAKKIAWQYTGRGAEYEDLVQEGMIALFELVRRYDEERPPQRLSLFIWYRLRGRVRDAAVRLRRDGAHDSLEQKFEDDGFDVPYEEGRYAVFELLESLPPRERELARGLASGLTQKELARRCAISQQAVSKRVRCLRDKVRRALAS